MNVDFHVVNALVPVADAFATPGQYTDVLDAGMGEGVLFIIQMGATAGDSAPVITILGTSTIGAAASTAVPFIYRACVATDVWGDWTAVAATGVTLNMTTANSMWQFYVDSAEIAETGYQYVRMFVDEVNDLAQTAGVLGLIISPRYAMTMPGSVLD